MTSPLRLAKLWEGIVHGWDHAPGTYRCHWSDSHGSMSDLILPPADEFMDPARSLRCHRLARIGLHH